MRSRFAYAAILALTFALLVPSAAVAAEKQISMDVAAARVAALNQLIALNIDPTTAVFQIGSRNYAGPNCPGSGWNCTSASTVVQIGSGATLSSQNRFDSCSASDCTGVHAVVQTNTTGDNTASCQQRTSTPSAIQKCEIRQTNAFGRNTALIGQFIDQSQGSTQTGTQEATLRQSNVSGQNFALIGQAIQQQVQGKTTDQEATQKADVCQGGGDASTDATCTTPSDTGSNFAGIGQALTQQATARPGGVISQLQQHTASGATATSLQKSTSGTNETVLRQPHSSLAQVGNEGDRGDGGDDTHSSQAQLSTAAVIASTTQTQGNFHSGLHGTINQDSSGISTSDTRQDELQTLRAPIGASQSQIGPEFCCSTQATNPGDTDMIVQRTVQTANSNATQGDTIEGDCFTSGTCDISQQATQNGKTTTSTPCAASPCVRSIVIGGCSEGCIGVIAPVWSADRRTNL